MICRRDVRCWECGMLGKWHIEHVRCWGCEDVGDVEYWEFGMFRIPDDGGWDVRDMGCGMWDVCRDLG